MSIENAVQILKPYVKHSTALDEFLHVDLTLAPASKREDLEKALKTVKLAVEKGEVTKEEVNGQLFTVAG